MSVRSVRRVPERDVVRPFATDQAARDFAGIPADTGLLIDRGANVYEEVDWSLSSIGVAARERGLEIFIMTRATIAPTRMTLQ